MLYVNDVRKNFFHNLKLVFSENEITSIWNQWVVKELLKLSLIEYVAKSNFLLEKKYVKKIDSLAYHLVKKKPIQYFFGYTYFKGLKININESVLIPRPETEELVDLVLNYANKRVVNQIIDIGVGSGCISIALKKQLSSNILGLDCCGNALVVAEKNAKLHDLDIEFSLIDILNHKNYEILPKVDVIVSNPPYVLKSDILMNSNIQHEPSVAIFVPKEDPLIFYKAICQFANFRLNNGGKIFFEINPCFVSDLVSLIDSFGYLNMEIRKDFYDKKRFIIVSS